MKEEKKDFCVIVVRIVNASDGGYQQRLTSAVSGCMQHLSVAFDWGQGCVSGGQSTPINNVF